jgi:signal transduction histidine kinase
MNQLAASRYIPRQEAYCTVVVDSHQPLLIPDTLAEKFFTQSVLTQHYGIRAYLGTPLLTAEERCIGTLAVMDLVPRSFTARDVEFLTLTARWCLREFERNHLLNNRHLISEESSSLKNKRRSLNAPSNDSSSTIAVNTIKLKLLSHLSQELRTPLTAIIGMSSILRGEVFGSLTPKQKEYIDIVHNSGQHLNTLLEEILKLGDIEEEKKQTELSLVNVEMICQQVVSSLSFSACQKRQQLRLSVEPGKRIWLLDKDKVRQILYYFVMGAIDLAKGEGEIRIHVSRRDQTLNIAIWTSYPWLGDGGSPAATLYPAAIIQSIVDRAASTKDNSSNMQNHGLSVQYTLSSSSIETALHQSPDSDCDSAESTIPGTLSLLLGCHIAELHGGKVMVQGSVESGYRYAILLPEIESDEISGAK